MENEIITSRDWPAPAKLNLFLHIVGRRDDGYHLLQTVFQFLDYSDTLEFTITPASDIALSGNYTDHPAEHDLIVRAARLLQSVTRCSRGAEITVNKILPMGGGLGGGSSNAATTLLALNQLWETGLGEQELADLALQLGADVPVFIHGKAAFAEGVGEILSPIEPAENWYLVINPGIRVATAEIFSADDLTRNTPAITIRDFLNDGGHNDCENPVRQRYPEVAAALDWLQQHSEAKMTGTGSCIFAGFTRQEDAESVCEKIPDSWTGFVAKGLNQSPLMVRQNQVDK